MSSTCTPSQQGVAPRLIRARRTDAAFVDHYHTSAFGKLQDDLLEVARADQRDRVFCHFHRKQLVSQLGLLYMLTRVVQKVYDS